MQEPVEIGLIVAQSLGSPVLGMPLEKINPALKAEDFSKPKWDVPRQEVPKVLADKANKPSELGMKPDQVRAVDLLMSKVETAIALAAVRSHATAELSKIEQTTKVKLNHETNEWRQGRQRSIDEQKKNINGIKSKLTGDIEELTRQQAGIAERLIILEAEVKQSAEESVGAVEKKYNHQRLIEALKQEIILAKKEFLTGLDKTLAALKPPQPTIIGINEIKAVDKALIQDPDRLKNVLVRELGVFSDIPRSSKAYVDNVYKLAKLQLVQYDQNPALVDYVRNHIEELVDPDFDATFILRGEDWKASRYTHLQEELITLGMAAVILRTDRKLPDAIKPIVEGLRGQAHDSSVETIKVKRMQTGDYAAATEEKTQINKKKSDTQKSLGEAETINEGLLQQEQQLDEEVRASVEKGMELLYAQLYPESDKFLHHADKSYMVAYADKLTRAYLNGELWARDREVDTTGIYRRLQSLREQIAGVVVPDADEQLRNQVVEFFTQTDKKHFAEGEWDEHQFDVADRILKGDKIAVCQANDLPALVQTIDALMQGSTTKEFDLILGENPTKSDNLLSKRKSRPIRINADQGEYAVISIPRNNGEYTHFILSKQDKKLLRVENSDTLDGPRKIRQDNIDYPNDRLFWAFLNDTSANKGDGVAHKMFFLSKEQKK